MHAVQQSINTTFQTRPVASLGCLDRLPSELVAMVLQSLDVLSYFRFRQVNRRARVSSTSLREYSLVARYALESLRSLLRAKLAHCFTITELYLSLIRRDCVVCGAFGNFLFLFTLARCCFECIHTSPNFCVLTTSAFSKLAHVSSNRLYRMSTAILHTVPGSYSMERRTARRPKCLLSEEQAVAVLQSLGRPNQQTLQTLRMRDDQINLRFMVATSIPWYDVETAKVEHGVSCKGCQIRVEESNGSYEDRDRIHSTTGFLAHNKHCSESQLLWAESRCGTIEVDEPAFTRYGGYFSKFGPDGRPR